MSFALRLERDFAWDEACTGEAERTSENVVNANKIFLNIIESFSHVEIDDFRGKKKIRFS